MLAPNFVTPSAGAWKLFGLIFYKNSAPDGAWEIMLAGLGGFRPLLL